MKVPKFMRRLVTGAVATCIAATGSVAIAASSAHAASCGAYTIIGVRGTNDGSYYSMGTQLPTAVYGFQFITGSASVTTDYVAYPASTDYVNSMSAGRAALRTKINYWLGACPSTKLALFGYSQGAHVVGDVVVGMSLSQRGRLQGVGLVGDPMFNPSLGGSISNNTLLGIKLGGMWGRRASWPSGVFVRDVCNNGDQVCGSTSLSSSLLFLTNTGGHHTYTTTTYSPVAPNSGAWYIGKHVAMRS